MADDTEQITHFKGGAARRVEQFLVAKQGRNAGAVRHFQLAQGSADAPVLCVEAINKEFPLAGDMHFKG